MAMSPSKTPQSWSEEFKILYHDVRTVDPNLITLSPEVIERISGILQHDQSTADTARYVMGATGAMIALALSAVLIRGSWVFFSSYSSHLLSLLAPPRLGALAIAGLVFALTATSYAIMLPLTYYLFRGNHSFLPRSSYMWIDLKNRRFLLFAGICIYLAFPIIVGAIISADSRAALFVHVIATAWSCPTLVLLAFSLAVLMSTVVYRRPHAGTQRVALELLRLIHKLGDVTAPAALTRDDRQQLLNQIGNCSSRIRRLYPDSMDAADDWAQKQVGLAADNFLALSSWLYFPQQGTIESLRSALCTYANIFLTGNLHELPRGETSELQGLYFSSRPITVWAKLLLFLSALAYLGVPPGTVLFWVIYKRITIPAVADGPLILLYIIWTLCGIAVFAEKFSPDARTMFVEGFKAVIGRK